MRLASRDAAFWIERLAPESIDRAALLRRYPQHRATIERLTRVDGGAPTGGV